MHTSDKKLANGAQMFASLTQPFRIPGPCLFSFPYLFHGDKVVSSLDGPQVPNPQCPPAVSALPLQSPGGWQLDTVYCVLTPAMVSVFVWVLTHLQNYFFV